MFLLPVLILRPLLVLPSCRAFSVVGSYGRASSFRVATRTTTTTTPPGLILHLQKMSDDSSFQPNATAAATAMENGDNKALNSKVLDENGSETKVDESAARDGSSNNNNNPHDNDTTYYEISNNFSLEELFQRLQGFVDHPNHPGIVIAVAGGGGHLLSSLSSTPGASQVLLQASILYDRESYRRYIQQATDVSLELNPSFRYASTEASRYAASASLKEALEISASANTTYGKYSQSDGQSKQGRKMSVHCRLLIRMYCSLMARFLLQATKLYTTFDVLSVWALHPPSKVRIPKAKPAGRLSRQKRQPVKYGPCRHSWPNQTEREYRKILPLPILP